MRWIHAILILLTAAAAVGADSLRPLGRGAFEGLVEGRSQEPFLLVLWSTDCPPCLKEFQVFSELRQAGRDLPVVLVSTDGLARKDSVVSILQKFGLQDLENWVFADPNSERLRYEIDPSWYGEMPRSYFYAADGSRTGLSGGLKHDQIVAWLDSL